MSGLRTPSLFLGFAALLNAQGPPPGAGQTVQSLAAEVVALTTRVTNLEGRVTAVEGRATNLEGRTTALEAGVTNLGSRATSLETRATSLEGRASAVEGRATSLETRASKLESGQVIPADLVGNWVLYGFQNELATNFVASYVFAANFVLNANFTWSATGTENGHFLTLPTLYPNRTVQNFPGGRTGPPTPETFSGTWSYANGVLNFGPSFGSYLVGAGGRIFTGAGANDADNTNVIIVGTRLP